MDQWVVESVKSENKTCNAVISSIRAKVEDDIDYLDSVDIPRTSLNVQTTIYKEGPPDFVSAPASSRSIYDGRFQIKHLKEFYQQFRSCATHEEFLEQNTFSSLMIQNY